MRKCGIYEYTVERYYSTMTEHDVIMCPKCLRLCHLSRDYGLNKGGHLEWGPTTNLGYTRAYGAYLLSDEFVKLFYGSSATNTDETLKSDRSL
jgi:hypothetical protein